MKLNDKITIAAAGPIKSGVKTLIQKLVEEKEVLFESILNGNFWVPKVLHTIEDRFDSRLFERYSEDPARYAYEFQTCCFANRLEQQDQIDALQGLVLSGQPLSVDRWIYAEANKEYIGEKFSTYERLYGQIDKRVNDPDVYLYLRVTDIDVLLERIKQYGRPGERQFLEDPAYLRENIRLNEEFFMKQTRKPVVVVDATHLEWNLKDIAEGIRKAIPPPRLSLDEWEAVDHNSAKKAMRVARRQLRDYLQCQKLISFAGLVGVGKTGMAEFISDELEIGIMRELDGKNDEVFDKKLASFLQNMEEECYGFQKHITPKRPIAEKEVYDLGRSFATDRSKEEDVAIFQRNFLNKGYLTPEQATELWELAKREYAKGPKSDCLIKLTISPEESRRRILQRGRLEETKAWPLEELRAMHTLYSDFFDEVKKLEAHQGPCIDLDLAIWNPDNNIHQGYLFQEMLHGMIEYD